MRQFLGILAVGVAMAALSAQGAPVTFAISDGSGKPLQDAVVTLALESGETTAVKASGHEHFIDQRDETFLPLVEIVPIGDTIIFRNSDKTRHHVYSFSPLGSFEFVLKPTELSKQVSLQKPGVIAVGCNIHDFMINYLFVTDKNWAAKSDDKGAVRWADVPPGNYVAQFWHPRLRPGGAWPTQKIVVGADGVASAMTLQVLPDHRDDDDHERY